MTIEPGALVLSTLKKNKQWSQWLAVFSATITLFTTGVCFTWTSPSLVILQSVNTPYNITNNEASWIASLLPFGSALGPIFGSYMARHLGPKFSTLSSNFPFLVGFVLIIIAEGPMYLYVSRFLSGIGVGFAFTTVPIYIGEIAEDHNRGALMILFTMMLSLGSLFISCIAPYITISLMATISLVFPVIALFAFSFMPDSPFFLIRSGNEKKAIDSLLWLRRQSQLYAIEQELDVIKKSVENDQMSFFECMKQIKTKPNPKGLLIIFMIVLAQQFSGVLAVSFYQEQIYKDTQIPMDSGIAVIISQIISNITGISSIFFIDRWGRKPLLLLSSFGCGISTALIGVYYQLVFIQETYPNFSWLPTVATVTFLISFSIGLGPIPYTVLGEIFASNFKEIAICLISISGALAGTLVSKLFQIVNDSLGSSVVFFGLSGTTFILMFYNSVMIPETMNKSLLAIQNMLLGIKEDTPKKQEITRF